MTTRPRPVVLCILDGWGDRADPADNAIADARTPVWHELLRRWPHAELDASEHYVGLPDGQMGNSEVGHTNLGAGRVVMQDLPRIDRAIADGSLARLPALLDFIGKVTARGGTAHVMGLLSPGGVHSHQQQIAALAVILAEAGLPVAVHAFLDGRDTPPKSAIGYLKQFAADVAGHGGVRIATVAGRYYAMDRDKRWDRVEKAYRVLTGPHPNPPPPAGEGIQGNPPPLAGEGARKGALLRTSGEPHSRALPLDGGGLGGGDRADRSGPPDLPAASSPPPQPSPIKGEGEQHAESALAAVEAAYGRGETDEFVLPTVIGDYRGMQDGDGVLFANFRADRIREIAGALLDPDFSGFARNKRIAFAGALGLTEYSEELNRFLATLFPPDDLSDTFGEIVSRAGMTQLRIAETEKYAHVTFFFNGGRETVFAGEERILVPSPKVATYDLQPEMSAPKVTDKVVAAIGSGRFDVVVLNYANTDMVGHTGRLDAAIKAVETVDTCLGRLAAAVEQEGGTLVITADHGNAEMMRDPATGEPHTAHTLNPVPFIVANAPAAVARVESGRLADVAPTLLEILGLPKPAAMTGHSLIVSDARRAAE